MLEFNDIFQLLILIMVGIITGIELYLLIINLKKPKNNIGYNNTINHPIRSEISGYAVHPPNIPTPFTTNVNI